MNRFLNYSFLDFMSKVTPPPLLACMDTVDVLPYPALRVTCAQLLDLCQL